MWHCYFDILAKIDEPPSWFDEQAVPRFIAFSPNYIVHNDVSECALLLIRCQSCSASFHVAMGAGMWSDTLGRRPLANEIAANEIHYGDPPNIGCCAAGPTMNSIPVRILEYWNREWLKDWERDPALEVDIHRD